MRRSALLFLCSIAPGGGIAACFGSSSSSSSGPNFDSGTNPLGDASFPMDSTAPLDGNAAKDGPGVVDAPADGPPTGMFPVTPVDFGLVGCGSAPAQPMTYSFTNTGPVPITYSASVGTSTLFGIQGASSGTVVPGATGSITLTAAMVPANSTAGTAITGTLTLTTDVPGFMLVTVPLKITPQGGSITLSPATAGFNTVELTVQAPDIPLTISNVGNAPVGVTLGVATDPQFAVVYTGAPGAVTVQPGASVPGAAARFKPVNAGLQSATSAITTTGVLCASPATSIAMNGTGTTQAVNAGPSPLDFGLVNCGTQSGTVLPVTITNGYSFVVAYTTTLAAGSTLYALDTPTGNVPAGGQAIIHVTPKPIPATASVAPGGFDDTLTINTNAPGAPSATIALQETAQGAILGLTVNNGGTFSNPVVAGTTGQLPFNVTNTGNLDAPITLTPSGAGYGAVFTGTSTATAGGGTVPGNATFTPTAPGTVSGSLRIGTTAAAVCAPLPGSAGLSATGVGPVATYSSATIPLSVTCGGGASNQPSLLITNNTAYPLTVAASSQNGLFGFVGSSNFTIQPNSSGNVTIQAPAAVVGTTVAGTYSDTLYFQTNEFGSPTHSVPVTLTVNGANFSATPSSFTFSTCGSPQVFTIENTGNATATITQPTNNGTVDFTGFSATAFQPSVTLTAGGSAGTSVLINPCGTSTATFDYTAPSSSANPVCIGATLPVQVTWNIACGGACC
jgi:hypothetical protein